jgi:hypothetical protein
LPAAFTHYLYELTYGHNSRKAADTNCIGGAFLSINALLFLKNSIDLFGIVSYYNVYYQPDKDKSENKDRCEHKERYNILRKPSVNKISQQIGKI